MPLRALPPQGSASTNFATRAWDLTTIRKTSDIFKLKEKNEVPSVKLGHPALVLIQQRLRWTLLPREPGLPQNPSLIRLPCGSVLICGGHLGQPCHAHSRVSNDGRRNVLRVRSYRSSVSRAGRYAQHQHYLRPCAR